MLERIKHKVHCLTQDPHARNEVEQLSFVERLTSARAELVACGLEVSDLESLIRKQMQALDVHHPIVRQGVRPWHGMGPPPTSTNFAETDDSASRLAFHQLVSNHDMVRQGVRPGSGFSSTSTNFAEPDACVGQRDDHKQIQALDRNDGMIRHQHGFFSPSTNFANPFGRFGEREVSDPIAESAEHLLTTSLKTAFGYSSRLKQYHVRLRGIGTGTLCTMENTRKDELFLVFDEEKKQYIVLENDKPYLGTFQEVSFPMVAARSVVSNQHGGAQVTVGLEGGKVVHLFFCDPADSLGFVTRIEQETRLHC